MAGTLVTNTISDGTNSATVASLISGGVKAWVNFNGTTGAIRASYNVTSVTRNGTGDYTINFTNALVDANYAVNLSAGNASTGAYSSNAAYSQAPTASALRVAITTVASPPVGTDATYVSVSVFR